MTTTSAMSSLFGQRAYHFPAETLAPPGDDHVARAIGDVEVTVGVQVADVAGGGSSDCLPASNKEARLDFG
jgi:hypothetical protein